MSDVAVRALRKSFGAQEVLRDCSFEIHPGERIGLVGANGSGKTTLFRILCGREAADSGSVQLASARRIGMLDQIPIFPDGWTVRTVLERAFESQLRLKSELDAAASQLAGSPDEEALRRFGALQRRFESEGGYEIEQRIDRVSIGLKIDGDMQTRLFESLSGGEKTRVNLAGIILQNTDLLLLDEPTNHLDIESVEWLEEHLRAFAGTVVVISHDRWFLDRTVGRILELENGMAVSWPGNYSAHAALKEQQRIEQLKRFEQEQKKIRQLEAAVKRMHDWAQRADNPKMHRRAFSMEKRLERMAAAGTERPKTERKLKSGFRQERFSGTEAISAEGLVKRFGSRALFDGASFTVIRGQSVALLGPNGSGKTTLLRMLLGHEAPDEGEIRLGPSIRCGFLPQEVVFDHPERSMIDTLRYAFPMDEGAARSRLAGFGFTGELPFKAVGGLSGGERSRLKLCLLMQEDFNLLVLDEPTNHLDIRSREWVEEALESWSGTLLFVSHDRYFIRRFATRVLLIENGGITSFDGDYEDFREWQELRESEKAARTEAAAASEEGGRAERERREAKERQRRLGSQRRKAAQAEQAVQEAEARLTAIDGEMGLHPDNHLRLGQLFVEKEQASGALEAAYEAWMREIRLLEELEREGE